MLLVAIRFFFVLLVFSPFSLLSVFLVETIREYKQRIDSFICMLCCSLALPSGGKVTAKGSQRDIHAVCNVNVRLNLVIAMDGVYSRLATQPEALLVLCYCKQWRNRLLTLTSATFIHTNDQTAEAFRWQIPHMTNPHRSWFTDRATTFPLDLERLYFIFDSPFTLPRS